MHCPPCLCPTQPPLPAVPPPACSLPGPSADPGKVGNPARSPPLASAWHKHSTGAAASPRPWCVRPPSPMVHQMVPTLVPSLPRQRGHDGPHPASEPPRGAGFLCFGLSSPRAGSASSVPATDTGLAPREGPFGPSQLRITTASTKQEFLNERKSPRRCPAGVYRKSQVLLLPSPLSCFCRNVPLG